MQEITDLMNALIQESEGANQPNYEVIAFIKNKSEE